VARSGARGRIRKAKLIFHSVQSEGSCFPFRARALLPHELRAERSKICQAGDAQGSAPRNTGGARQRNAPAPSTQARAVSQAEACRLGAKSGWFRAGFKGASYGPVVTVRSFAVGWHPNRRDVIDAATSVSRQPGSRRAPPPTARRRRRRPAATRWCSAAFRRAAASQIHAPAPMMRWRAPRVAAAFAA
jgi:hypothetical protein